MSSWHCPPTTASRLNTFTGTPGSAPSYTSLNNGYWTGTGYVVDVLPTADGTFRAGWCGRDTYVRAHVLASGPYDHASCEASEVTGRA